MGEYDSVELGDVASVRSGFAFKSSEWTESGIPVVKIANVKDGRLVMDSCSYVPLHIAESAAEFALQAGDILIAMTGYIGDVAMVRERDLPATLNQRVGRFSVRDPHRLDQRFLLYLLRDADVRKAIEGRGYGSAQPNVSPSLIHSVEVPLPPLPKQRAIAHILGTLDDKIELNRRMNETLESMARALFKSWFVAFEPVRAKAEGRHPGLPKPLADLFPNSFEDSALGEIPRAWTTGVIDDLANISSGKRPEVRYSEASAEANIPLWGGNGPMAFVPKALIDHPILLTGRVGTLGVVFRITTLCWPSDNTLILRAKNATAFEYLFFQLRHIDYNSLNRGSTQPLLTQSDLKEQPVVLPPSELLAYFHAATRDLYRRVDELNTESLTLTALRDTLLPKLISGELRVKDAERFLNDRGL